jgi:ADP-ribose pyrophosphatase YjhB (NUDIX family)
MAEKNRIEELKKLPKDAKKVFEGVLFDVYQWKQKMFDGSYETFEAIVRDPTVQIIPITKDKKIIVLEEEQPHIGKFFSLVGGHVEKNQTIEEAVYTELEQETGMKCSKIKNFLTKKGSGKILWSSYYYIAFNCEKVKEQNLDPGEKIKIIELKNFDEFIKFVKNTNFRNKYFQEYIKKLECENRLEEFKKIIFEE